MLDDGRRLEGDRIVWACGAWLARLFPDALGLRVTRQEVTYFGATPAWSLPGASAWVDYDGAAYGHPDLDGRGVKVCSDVEGEPFDPEFDDRTPSEAGSAAARATVANLFPVLADQPLLGGRVCQYALTPDTHFVAAPQPGQDGAVWLYGGGSGHGFKHGPALAEGMADWLAGSVDPPVRFALAPRQAAGSMRTAGGEASR